MMLPLIALLWVLVLLTGAVTKALGADWPNEPAGSERLVDCGYVTPDCAGQYKKGTYYSIYGGQRIVTDGSAPLSPPSVAVAGKSAGSTSGGGQSGWYNSDLTKDMYIGFKARLNPAFDCNVIGKNKLFHVRGFDNLGGNRRTNGVFMLEGCGTVKTLNWSHNTGVDAGQPALNNSHVCGGDAIGNTCANNAGPSQVRTGEWVTIEVLASAGSGWNTRDGCLKWFVNGQPGGSYPTINIGTMLNQWDWNMGWDGNLNGQGFRNDSELRIDHLVIGRPPAGTCRGNMPPPVVTPGAILDLKVTVTP